MCKWVINFFCKKKHIYYFFYLGTPFPHFFVERAFPNRPVIWNMYRRNIINIVLGEVYFSDFFSLERQYTWSGWSNVNKIYSYNYVVWSGGFIDSWYWKNVGKYLSDFWTFTLIYLVFLFCITLSVSFCKVSNIFMFPYLQIWFFLTYLYM